MLSRKKKSFWAIVLVIEGLNGVNCQPSNDQKFSRQSSKRAILAGNRQKLEQLILAFKWFQVLLNVIISAALLRLLALKESF